MNDRPIVEVRLLMHIAASGRYELTPFQQATPDQQRDVQAGKWAEVSIPFHPTDTTEPLYGFLVFIVGKPNSELAVIEIMALEADKEDIYRKFKTFAKPMFEWEWEA